MFSEKLQPDYTPSGYPRVKGLLTTTDTKGIFAFVSVVD